MMNFLNGDPTLLLVGAGGLLIGLVIIFQFLTRPPARQTGEDLQGSEANSTQAIRILARKPLDDRRTLVSIRYGNSDHLLLLGEDGDLLIQTSPTPLRERHQSAQKATSGIPMPFPPQPAAKLNMRTTAQYQTANPIAVPDFLQSRAGQPAFGSSSQPFAAAASHPIMPQAAPAQSPVAVAPVAVAPPAIAPAIPSVEPRPPAQASDDVARKLEEAMRAHTLHIQSGQAAPPQPAPQMPPHLTQQAPSAPPAPFAAPPIQHGSNSPEAFEDEIRKLLGRAPHNS